jgi:hypothetical protein
MTHSNASNVTEIIATRAVHTAMAASVQANGLDCSKALYVAAARFNQDYFGGQLTALLVEITAPASPRALATHQPRTPEGVDCVIRIAPSVVEAGTALALDTLLHEMIHVWQTETDNHEPGYAGHGPKFAAECNRIGALLGLPEVGVKGRDGKPDCAQWPLNVRPEGFYGDAPRAGKAVAAATKTRAPRAARKAKAAPVAPPTALETIAFLLGTLSPEDRETVRQLVAELG